MNDKVESQQTEDQSTTPNTSEQESKDELDIHEDTPQRVQSEVIAYKNRLSEIGVDINGVTESYHQDDDGEQTDKLKSLILQCNWQRTPFLVLVPINESFTLFQAEYDLLEAIIYSSDHEDLGGDFQNLTPDTQWNIHQEVRQSMSHEQAIGLCQANRSVRMPTIDARIGLLSASTTRFTIDPTRIQFEYIGAVAVRRIYHSVTDFTTQDLYDTVVEITDLYNGIQNILGGSYLLDGVQVPEDYENIGKEAEDAPPYHRDAFQ